MDCGVLVVIVAECLLQGSIVRDGFRVVVGGHHSRRLVFVFRRGGVEPRDLAVARFARRCGAAA
eukprot:6174926-Pleurochrysis_carterae.AAC.1